MFVIRCPHCNENREEEEFGYGGEAFIARPANPEAETDESWADYLFGRKNIKGWNWEMWGHSAGCRQFFVVKRNTTTHVIEGSWTLAEAKVIYEKEMVSIW